MESRVTYASTGALVARGLTSLAFGAIVLIWPNVTLHIILVLFALYALLGGAASAVAAIIDRHDNESWVLGLIFGLISAFIGIYLLSRPEVTAVVLSFFIGLYAVAAGIIDIVAGVSLRKQIKGEWLLVIVGVLAIFFGLYVFANPGAGAVAIVWLIGIYALVSGTMWLAAALSHHGADKRLKPARR